MSSILISNGTIVNGTGTNRQNLFIEDGIVHFIRDNRPTDETIDASNLLLLPAFIDVHVHFREPGDEHKETIATGAAAARAGGVKTVCEMPNTKPPTVSIEALQWKIKKASGVEDVDIRFFFGVTERSHLGELKQLWTDPRHGSSRKRCSGVKIYFDHSTGNQKVDEGLLDDLFLLCKNEQIPLVAHCEDADTNADAAATKPMNTIADHSLRRPPLSEVKAIERAISLCEEYGTPLHIAHVSTKEGVSLIAQAKKETLPVTCEVTPHHLLFTTDDYDRLGSRAKVNPPLRTKEHRDALWKGIKDGTIDCVASDHAPHTPEEKNSSPSDAPSGMPGVETMIPLLLTIAFLNEQRPSPYPLPRGEGSRAVMDNASDGMELSYQDIVRLCFDNPNRIFGLRKKGIAEGAPADLVLVDPSAAWTLQRKDIRSKCGWSAYEGMEFVGKIVRVVA